MKQLPLHRFAVVISVLGIALFVAPFAHAETLSLPQQLAYDGLTFSEPLTYTTKTPLPKPTKTIAFSSQHKLELNDNAQKKPLETVVVTPTMTTQKAPSPTPTLFLQPTTKADNKKITTPYTEQPSVTPTATLTPPPPAPRSTAGGLNPDTLFAMVNSYRQSKGLPAFQQDEKTCSLAASRAPEIAGELASGAMHSGLKARNLPYWNTENIISMNSEQAAFTWWINDPIHKAAIESSNVYSCVACSGNACAEEFTSYQPK